MQRHRFRTAACLMASVLTLSVALFNRAEAAATAPSFEVITLGGETFSKDSLKGHPTLLVFWAPWCKVCQRELPLLSQFTSKDKPAQLGVISIGFADSRGNVEGFVKAHPEAFAFPTAFDIDNDVAQAFKVTATPRDNTAPAQVTEGRLTQVAAAPLRLVLRPQQQTADLEGDYTLGQIRDRLMADDRFSAVISSRGQNSPATVRLIPVSAVGPGFATANQPCQP